MSIILADLDDYIISQLTLPDIVELMKINQYYYNKIKPMRLITEWNIMKVYWESPSEMLYMSCIRGYTKYAESLSNRYEIKTNFQTLFEKTCCDHGHFETAAWLYNTFGKIDLHRNKEQIFRLICQNGNLKAAKFLIELGEKSNSKIDVHIDIEKIFQVCCQSNHIEVAKWLVDLGENHGYGKINIHDDNERIFRSNCYRDHLEIVKWLVDLGENHGYGKFNIHYQNDRIFQQCCEQASLKMIKWLIDLGENHGYGKIDIHANNDIAIRSIFQHNDGKIQFLINLGENHGYGKFCTELLETINKKKFLNDKSKKY